MSKQSLKKLLNKTEPAWPLVLEWIASATNHVEVLPVSKRARSNALLATQVTTRSPMGAIVYETGGILVDHGWIRILGSGHPRLSRTLPGWNKGRTCKNLSTPPCPFVLVADDVLGGFFAMNGGGLGTDMGHLYYFAPDALEWEPMGMKYTPFIQWCFSGEVSKFYKNYRWKGWQKEIEKVNGDQTLFFMPFLWAKGPRIRKRIRGVVSITETYGLNVVEFPRQLAASQDENP